MRAFGAMEIRRDERGYYTLVIDGEFAGNFDSVGEAISEYESLLADN